MREAEEKERERKRRDEEARREREEKERREKEKEERARKEQQEREQREQRERERERERREKERRELERIERERMLQQQRMSESSKMNHRERSPLRNGNDSDISRIKEEPKREEEMMMRAPAGVVPDPRYAHAHLAAASHYMVGRHMMQGQLPQVSFVMPILLFSHINIYNSYSQCDWLNPFSIDTART